MSTSPTIRESEKKKRVIVGMSGGVDSSVAAYLLQQEGWDIVGVTMKLWPQDCMSRAEDKCCGPQAIADARSVAHALGIPHYVIDEAVPFEKIVIDYFSEEYKRGRTPNPCIMCNEKLKFGNLWEKAAALGAEYIATGHYAIIDHEGEKATLRKGLDETKDQSYFLFSLRESQLKRALCPLGRLTKREIRSIARKLGLKVADKQESQEICFVPGKDYKAFLRSRGDVFQPGGFYDTEGNYLGEHDGIELFTVGQRKGLPGGSPHPLYVIAIDAEKKRVILGKEGDLLSDVFEMDRLNWLEPIPDPTQEISVRVRHGHEGSRAKILSHQDDYARVSLLEPIRSVTPGQAAVFYLGVVVLGGGWIKRREQENNNS